jgi:HEAT repeat protein
MNLLKFNRSWQSTSQFAVSLLMCCFILGFVPAGYGQTDNVSQLISKFKVKDGTDHSDVMKAFAKIGTSAVEPLIAALKDPDSSVRQGAAGALGEIKDPRAIEPLIAVLKDSEFGVRLYTVRALGNFNDHRIVGPLIGALKDTDQYVRYAATGELGAIKDPLAVEPLITALQEDPESNVRQNAAWALSNIEDPRVVEPIIAALKDKDLFVQWVVAQKVAKMNNPRAANALMAALRERNFPVIVGAESFFIKRGEPGSEDALIEALQSGIIGTPKMAQDFLYCGNKKLEVAAREWAASHNSSITPTSNGKSVMWGSARETSPQKR